MTHPGERSPGRPPASHSSVVLIMVLAAIAVIVGVLLFTVVSPSPEETTTGVAHEFVARLEGGKFDQARDLLCADGKARLGSGTALRDSLGFDPRTISGFRVGAEVDANGSKTVTVRLDGVPDHRALTLEVVQQHGRQTVCGIG